MSTEKERVFRNLVLYGRTESALVCLDPALAATATAKDKRKKPVPRGPDHRPPLLPPRLSYQDLRSELEPYMEVKKDSEEEALTVSLLKRVSHEVTSLDWAREEALRTLAVMGRMPAGVVEEGKKGQQRLKPSEAVKAALREAVVKLTIRSSADLFLFIKHYEDISFEAGRRGDWSGLWGKKVVSAWFNQQPENEMAKKVLSQNLGSMYKLARAAHPKCDHEGARLLVRFLQKGQLEEGKEEHAEAEAPIRRLILARLSIAKRNLDSEEVVRVVKAETWLGKASVPSEYHRLPSVELALVSNLDLRGLIAIMNCLIVRGSLVPNKIAEKKKKVAKMNENSKAKYQAVMSNPESSCEALWPLVEERLTSLPPDGVSGAWAYYLARRAGEGHGRIEHANRRRKYLGEKKKGKEDGKKVGVMKQEDEVGAAFKACALRLLKAQRGGGAQIKLFLDIDKEEAAFTLGGNAPLTVLEALVLVRLRLGGEELLGIPGGVDTDKPDCVEGIIARQARINLSAMKYPLYSQDKQEWFDPQFGRFPAAKLLIQSCEVPRVTEALTKGLKAPKSPKAGPLSNLIGELEDKETGLLIAVPRVTKAELVELAEAAATRRRKRPTKVALLTLLSGLRFTFPDTPDFLLVTNFNHAVPQVLYDFFNAA